MPKDDTPEPRTPSGLPPAPVTSINGAESPDAAEAREMSDQRSGDRTATEEAPEPDDRARGTAQVPGGRPPNRAEPARGKARVRPAGPAEATRTKIADIQTTEGVPAKPIPPAQAAAALGAAPAPEAEVAPQAAPEAEAQVAPEAEAEAQVEAPEAEVEVEAPDVEAESPEAEEPVAADAEVAAPDSTETVEAEPDQTPAEPEAAVETAEPDAEIETAEPEADVETAEPEADEVVEADAVVETVTPDVDEPAPAEDGTEAAEPDNSQPQVEAEPEPEAEVEAPLGDHPTQVIPVVPAIDETVRIIPGEETVKIIPGERTQRIIPGAEETRRITVVPGRSVRTQKIPVAAPLAQPEVERRKAPRGGPYDLGRAPWVLLLSSLGVLLVALAYTGGRTGADSAPIAYWIGQVVVFTPVVLRLLSRRMAGVAESFLLVMGLAINQYLLKWMYSPDQFRFPDELQHWLATTTIMETGKLFQPNPALPPAVHFPGLAEMGAAMASMTGLPVSGAGIIVAGVAHLVFVGVLFVCVLRASNSPAVAGVACATYATALHYLFFSSMFLYQTAALPFFMLTIWATRRWRAEGGKPFQVIAIGSMAMTTVSHHVTAFALVATLLLLGVTELFTERPRRWSALAMPLIALGVVTAWILLVARDVISYLEEPVQQVATTIDTLMGGTSDASTAAPAAPIYQLILQGSGLLGLLVLFIAVARDMVIRRDRDSWRWAAVIGGLVFFAGNGVRFLGQNGPEIAGRLSTFTYIPISIVAAIALVRAVQILPSRDSAGRRHWVAPALATPPPTGRNLVVRVLAGSALVTLLMIGARAGGWPPLGSLLPGPYLAGGFERSVDAYGVDAAEWELRVLGPGNRVGGDVTSVSLASTYGRQDPVREVGPLYYADEWGLNEDELVASIRVNYLVVDRRLSTQLPQSEAYFENDPHAGRITEPLTTRQLTKFDALTDVDRLYDNGTVRIYRMGVQ